MKNYTRLNDKELIELAGHEKEPEKSSAFSELYNRYSNCVYLYCRKIFGDGNFAEDIFQDTFLQLLKSIENKVIIGDVQRYLLKSARNLTLNFKRNNKVNFVEFDDYHAFFNDLNFEKKELAQMIDAALELLPEEHKEAFILQTYQGFSYNEISVITEVPVSTVRNRVVRAKSKLKEILSPMLEEGK